MAAPGIDGLQPGLWVPPGAPFCAQASVNPTANRGCIIRFACPRSMAITKIAFFVTVAASVDDQCDVGIYAASASPLTLLGSSGAKSGLLNSTGVKQATLSAPVSLVQGQVYYGAFVCGPIGGTAAGMQMTTCAYANVWNVFGASPPQCEQTFNAAAFPLPASFSASGPMTSAPILALLQ